MKVSELIAELQKMPQDLRVISEGCDCYGDVGIVERDSWRVAGDEQRTDFVVLRRPAGEMSGI